MKQSVFLVWIIVFVLGGGEIHEALAGKQLVYIVHSYEKNHVCGQPQADGVLTALAESDMFPGKVTVRSYYMDTKITNTTPEAIRIEAGRALAEIAKFKPEVVVTLDDNAFKHVGLALAGRSNVQVVFSGLNGQPETYNKMTRFMESREHPGGNITGVYEKLHLMDALEVLGQILPDLTKVVGITDFSPSGNAITRQFELEAATGLPVEWELRRVHTFAEYKELVNKLNKDDSVQAIYPVALTLPSVEKGRVTAPEIFKWTVENSTKPEIPLNYFFSNLGLFGGASVDFEYMGRLAGAQVDAILGGKSAGDLPIVDADDYAIVFNLARAKMLGISIPSEVLMKSDAVFQDMLLH